jgi:hypothetical protein
VSPSFAAAIAICRPNPEEHPVMSHTRAIVVEISLISLCSGKIDEMYEGIWGVVRMTEKPETIKEQRMLRGDGEYSSPAKSGSAGEIFFVAIPP